MKNKKKKMKKKKKQRQQQQQQRTILLRSTHVVVSSPDRIGQDVGAIEGVDGRLPRIERCFLAIKEGVPAVEELLSVEIVDGDVVRIAAIHD